MAYYNQEWDDLGRNIQNVVDRAVNSQDYHKLNQTIRQAVERSIDVGSEAVRTVMNGTAGLERTDYRPVPTTRLYGGTLGKRLIGGIQVFFGGIFSFGACISFLGAVFSQWLNAVDMIMSLILLAACLLLTYSGARTLGMVKRFKVYQRTLGNKTHCTVKNLARSVGKSEDFVRKELWRMIGKGLFLEGHMDKEETCLITSNETYQYYEQSRLQMEQRREAEKAQKPPVSSAPPKKEASASRDPKVQEVLDRGNAFIAQIRGCNDAIPGEEISEKISRIELIVQRIFERAEAHPEIVPDLEKLMDYYLPMTVKLLSAYADMDAQPVQGETIQSSKREIEATLDTLNLAFEKLLDSVFMDTAMDISSDISVLNTLLAQEGLTEDELSKIKKQQTL